MHNKSFAEIRKILLAGSGLLLTLGGTLTLAQTLSADYATNADKKKHHVLLVDDDKQECPDAGFSKIQAAVNAAAPGDTIQVCPGIYREQVEIAKPLSLVGIERNGKDAVVVRPSNITVNTDLAGEPTASIILVRHTSEVSIKNITVDGINNGLVCDSSFPTMDGIFFRNASGEIESVAVRNILSPQACAFADGIDVFSTGERPQRVTIRNSSIHDYDLGGIFALGGGLSVSAIGNVVTGRGPTDLADFGQAGIQFAGGATGSIEENVVTNHITADPENIFVAHNIGVFELVGNTRIVRNIVGTSNVGIFVGAFPNIESNEVVVQENTVSNTAITGIFVKGDDNVLKDNTVTDSGLAKTRSSRRGGIFAQGSNNRIQDNTINEAVVGLVVSTGNNVADNEFFNTPLLQQVFVPSASVESSTTSLQQTDIAPSILEKKLSR